MFVLGALLSEFPHWVSLSYYSCKAPVPGSARSLLPSLSLALRGNRAAKDQRDPRNQKKILAAGAES